VDARRIVTVSKFLSKHLRHQPEALGLTLEPGGWVRVEDLLAGCERAGFRISWAELNEVVEKNDKQRFGFDETGERIRANQGHSAPVDLQLEASTPPDVLFHGTADHAVAEILRTGVQRMSRHHVHLSITTETARAVGKRHGKPVILRVDAAAMYRDGVPFYLSDNGVWLVDEIPPQYLSLAE
jgi:putative RNA 2'-phosphotransferase